MLGPARVVGNLRAVTLRVTERRVPTNINSPTTTSGLGSDNG